MLNGFMRANRLRMIDMFNSRGMFYKFTDEDWETTQQHINAQEVPLDVLAVMLKRLLKLPSSMVESACMTMDEMDGCPDGFINLSILERVMRRHRVAMKSSRDMKLRRIALREEYRDTIYKREQLNFGVGMRPNQQTHVLCDELADELIEDFNHQQLHSHLQRAMDNRVATKPKRSNSARQHRSGGQPLNPSGAMERTQTARRPQSASSARSTQFQRRGRGVRMQEESRKQASGYENEPWNGASEPDILAFEGLGVQGNSAGGYGGQEDDEYVQSEDRNQNQGGGPNTELAPELEYIRLQVSEKLHQKYSHVTSAFVSIDKDRDGIVRMGELATMLQTFALRIPEREMMRLVRWANGGNDTLLTREQFSMLFQQEDMVEDENQFVGDDQKRMHREAAEKQARTMALREKQRRQKERERAAASAPSAETQVLALHGSITAHILAQHMGRGYGGDEDGSEGIPASFLVEFLQTIPGRHNSFRQTIAVLQANPDNEDPELLYQVGIQLASHLLQSYENLRSAFKQADTDHNGYVDHIELVRVMGNYHLPTNRVKRLLARAHQQQGGGDSQATLSLGHILQCFGQEFQPVVGPVTTKVVQAKVFPGVTDPVPKRVQRKTAPSRSLSVLDTELDHRIHANFAALAAMECAQNLKRLRQLLKEGLVEQGKLSSAAFTKVVRSLLGMQATNEEITILRAQFADQLTEAVSVQAVLRRVRAVLGTEKVQR
jgi:Ca2+-binding EF-hand superfamily protein